MLTAVQPPSLPGPGAVSTEPARFQERVGGRDPPVAQKPCLFPGTLLPNSELPEPQADRRGRALPPLALPFSAMTNTIITMTILKILFSAVRRGGTLARARPAPSPGPLGLGTVPATPQQAWALAGPRHRRARLARGHSGVSAGCATPTRWSRVRPSPALPPVRRHLGAERGWRVGRGGVSAPGPPA